MKFNPLAPEAQVFTYSEKSGYTIAIEENSASGIVYANTTFKNPRGNYGFNFDLSFKATFSDAIEIHDLVATKAITWSDRTPRSDSVEYRLGDEDVLLLTPVVIEAIKSKIKADMISTVLPDSFFIDSDAETDEDEQKVIEHLVIDFESDVFDINLSDDNNAHGCVHILIDDNVNFITEFKATYDTEHKPAVFSNGLIVSSKVNKAINIKVGKLEFSEFSKFDGELTDSDRSVSISDILLIKALIAKEIEKTKCGA